jgi:hypothetical protein
MIGRRGRRAQTDDGWLAGWLLDEGLRVFGALQAATLVDDQLDDPLRERFRTTALGVLDDVACLASLVMATPFWPRCPHDPVPEPPAATDQSPTIQAVEALAVYTHRLASVATVLTRRADDRATLYAGLAVAAQARMEVLAS